MARNKRNDRQYEHDLKFISQRMLQGFTVRAITQQLNEENEQNGYSLAHSQVYSDMKTVMETWREERKEFIDFAMEKELAKLDLIERECWQAWEKSKGGKRKTKIEGGAVTGAAVGGGKIKERSIEDSHGDVRFLHQVLDCMDRRINLLGIAAPKKVEFGGSVAVGTTYMDEETMQKERARVLKRYQLKAV